MSSMQRAKKIPYSTPEPDYSRLLAERLLSRTKANEHGCLEFQGCRSGKGYGLGNYKDQSEHAHRTVYRGKRGVIPEGWDVFHTCDNPPCINPLHLFAAPRAVNIQDMRAKKRGNNQRKTHCPKGHPYSGDNLYITPIGHRACVICQRAIQRKKYGWPESMLFYPVVGRGYRVNPNKKPDRAFMGKKEG